MKKYILAIAVTVFIVIKPHVMAEKLFAVDATYASGGIPGSIRVENSSFPDLIGDLINGRGGFSELSGKDVFTADIQFFGVPRALSLDAQKTNEGLYQVTLTSSLSGMSVNIVAVNQADLRKQIIDWIYLEAGDEALDFLQAIAIASTASVSDGTPGATTAQMADTAFGLFGFYQRTSTNKNMRGFESGAFFGFDVKTRVFTSATPVGDMQGDRLDLAVPLWLHFNSRFSYAGQINLNRTSIEGTDFFGFGADLGLAFRPVLRIDDDIFGWQITPYVGAKALGSVDGVTAAVLYDYGFNNRFEFRLMKRGLVSWVAQYSKYENLHVHIDEYSLNSSVNQQILKNGIILELPVFSMNSVNANFFLIDTRFLEEANTSNYQTLGLGLGYNRKSFSLQTNLGFDYAGGYQAVQVNLGCSLDL